MNKTYAYSLMPLIFTGKFVPVPNYAPNYEDVLGQWKYMSPHSLVSALDGDEVSDSLPWRRKPGTHLIGDWPVWT